MTTASATSSVRLHIAAAMVSISISLAPCFAGAQERTTTDTTPAFSVFTSHVFSSKERPSISITHRQVDHIDFRVYRVNDAFTFFEKLKDPHQLGSEEPLVPQERTWLERVAIWKAERRSEIRSFIRQQFTPAYRRIRREQADSTQVVQRRTVSVNSFAQVPVLNASQLVTSWREILPIARDAEYRHIPLDISAPGIYVVEAVNPPLRAYTVVVVSDIGLVTKTAPGQLLVFAANRFSGDPIAGCRVRVLADSKAVVDGNTSADGTFKADLTVKDPDDLVTLADCAGQTAATDPGAYTVRETPRTLAGYVYTDRPVYRPGHLVHFKSVLRWRERGALLPFVAAANDGRATTVEVTVSDNTSKVLLRERKSVDEFGSVTGSFTIPATASLGYYSVRVASGDETAGGSFEVQEYRKPEFDVAVRLPTRFELQGNKVQATFSARYYFGQPVSGASVHYVVHRQNYYSPLRWRAGDEDEDSSDGYFYGGEQVFEGDAKLNDQGNADVSIPLEIDKGGNDYTARVEARVTDASGREVAGAATVVATYGRFMVMADTERYVYPPGSTIVGTVRAVDYANTPVPGTPVHVALEHFDYQRAARRNVIVTNKEFDVTLDAEGRAAISITAPSEPGSYRIHASAPSEGRRVSNVANVWVTGNLAANNDTGDRFLELVADRKSYQPGDTAKVIVRGADFEASVLVTKENQYVSFHQVVKTRVNEPIEVPVGADDVGDTYVSIAFLKDDRLYRADVRLKVPATEHQLTITATTDHPVVHPGEPGVFTLHVADAKGAPVRAQLSVGLVDEALYGVRPDNTPDPLRFFYRREFNRVGTSFSRDYPFVGYSGTEQLQLAAHRRHPTTLADFKADRPDRPRVRKDFPDTAFWVGDIVTKTDGTAEVRINYPDSLTSWRLTVRAVTTDTAVGKVTTNTTTTKDLILRVVPPRFLTEGDQVTVPVVVHNYLPAAKNVALTLTSDGLSATRPAPTSVQVNANGQQRVDWMLTANQVRQVTLTGKAITDAAGDAMELSLPVLPAGLQRNSSRAGSIIDTQPQTVELTVPATSNASGRSVRVALAPSLAGTMLGALDYLTSFPWGCTEQTLSSFVPNLVVMRALEQLQMAPTERLQALDRQVSDGLKRLYDYQHEDGGWGWWKTDQNSPFMTAYAVDGLLQARDNRAPVDDYRINRGMRALEQLYAQYPRAVPDLKAYEIYVLAQETRAVSEPTTSRGFNVAAAIDELWSARSRMTATGRALLLMILDRRKDARGNDAAKELLALAQSRGDVAWWTADSDPLLEDYGDTSVEASGLALKALAAHDASNPVLERVARWLVLNRTSGYWVSTKQTALALEGLLAFMKARGEKPAPVTADVFVNDKRVGTVSFDAKSLTAPNPTLIEAPADAGTNRIRIVKQGAGALYYDAGVRYYDPPAASERTGSRKLALVRTYSTLTPVERNGRIVYVEGPFNGTARTGDLLLVRLVAAGSTDWRYLMLEDPIPAGTEPVEKESGYEFEQRRSWWYGSEREMRDDRVVYFLNDFTDGRYDLSYLLKVTTPGVFNAMPARISPMYVPDVSASSAAITVNIQDTGR